MNARQIHPSNGHHAEQHDEIEDHDRGLAFDLRVLVQRRNVLKLFAGGAGFLTLAACGSDSAKGATSSTSASSSASTATTATTSTTASDAAAAATVAAETACAAVPEETAGPYPGDGSNGVNVLGESGVVRSDIRSSFGSSATTAEGVPVTVNLTITSSADDCAPLAGGAVYLWHCDRDGRYSLYSEGAQDENYLRGVQPTDVDGLVSFRTVFPACYDGRWPHMHFEVYPSLGAATSADGKVATSQLALPRDVCEDVYATTGYESSVRNLSRVSLSSDMVFSDGADLETPVVTGSVADGYVMALTVTV
jgi:protocatechuate 3,4-dioxygenase beta subunit